MLKAAREDLMSTAFRVVLTGDQEVSPPAPAGGTGSKASGLGTVIFDSVAVEASYSFNIQGLDFGLTPPVGGPPQTPTINDDVTRVHFHSQVSGVNGPIVFGQIDPANDPDDLAIVLNADHSWTVSGSWGTNDTPSITTFSPLLGATFASVLGSATAGSEVPLYFNVHTNDFGGGEIRGQLVAIADDHNNVVEGTAGNDLLPGLGGDDNIHGGKGEDILVGGTGNDLLTGGQGLPDQFVFNAGFGKDIITDFKNQDQIQFEDGLFPNSEAVLAASQQVGDDVVITLDEDNTITLLDVKLSSLQADDFLT
jgi:serralysin